MKSLIVIEADSHDIDNSFDRIVYAQATADDIVSHFGDMRVVYVAVIDDSFDPHQPPK
jgi:hypothetical protein